MAHDALVTVWEIEWELEVPAAADWDERARPHLQRFLRAHGSDWTSADVDDLCGRLRLAGLGWLRRAGVKQELDRMRAARH